MKQLCRSEAMFCKMILSSLVSECRLDDLVKMLKKKIYETFSLANIFCSEWFTCCFWMLCVCVLSAAESVIHKVLNNMAWQSNHESSLDVLSILTLLLKWKEVKYWLSSCCIIAKTLDSIIKSVWEDRSCLMIVKRHEHVNWSANTASNCQVLLWLLLFFRITSRSDRVLLLSLKWDESQSISDMSSRKIRLEMLNN